MDEDIEFSKEACDDLYRFSESRVNPERWDRIQDQDFISLAEEITGQRCYRHSKVRCPFHGSDSSPSFHVYENNAYCWGCSKFYDNITLVQKYLDSNRLKALVWCEEFFNLPHMQDVPPDAEEDIQEEDRPLTFQDVRKVFITYAVADIQKVGTPRYAEDYLRQYFEGKGNKEEEAQAAPLLSALPVELEQSLLDR